jgi:hypothetical protein
MLARSVYSDEPQTATGTHAVPWPEALLPRHVKITGAAPAFGFERCEDVNCQVQADGTASSCGRLACPACGCGGTNLAILDLVAASSGSTVGCSCGHSWLQEEQRFRVPSVVAVFD